MRYSEFCNDVFSVEDLIRYTERFTKSIQQYQDELARFIKGAHEHISQIEEYEKNNDYRISGYTEKYARVIHIDFTVDYPDGTQQNKIFTFKKVSDMRVKLQELKEKYSGVDWSKFEENI